MLSDQGLYYLLTNYSNYVLTDYNSLQTYLNSGYRIIDASYNIPYLQSLAPSGANVTSTLSILGTTIQTGANPVISENYIPIIILLVGILGISFFVGKN